MYEGGVYRIDCIPSGKSYYGRSNNITKRIRAHKSRLSHGFHDNPGLREDYGRYGADAFTFNPIFMTDDYRLAGALEHQLIMDGMRDKSCYNVARPASSRYPSYAKPRRVEAYAGPVLKIGFSNEMHNQIVELAKAAGVSPSEWARRLIVRKMNRERRRNAK